MAKVARLTVRAEGSVQVAPDRANVNFRVRAREGDRSRSVDRVRQRQQQLYRILDRYEVPERGRRTQQITSTQLVDPKTRKGIGYEASALTTIRLDDFTHLGTLIDAAGSQGDVDVSGPVFEVSATNPGHLEACRRATATARLRAAALAEGLDTHLGRVVSVQEGEMRQQRGPQMTMPYAAAPLAAAPGGEAVQISSGVVRLSSVVIATFEIEEQSAALPSHDDSGASTGSHALPSTL